MKLDKLVGERFKERPADCVIDSHALMVRGGYMKYVANGIYSQYMPLKRIMRKIEQIIREEMDAVDGQEVLFPVVLPGSLWEESGRYESVGSELLRMKDRNGSPLVLGMTHEEAAVQLVREYGGSYTRYPFMVYQIQTKFRDEPRARGGLIRVREFTMKDAYSFHTSQEDLEAYYKECFRAYERVYKRAGLKNVVAVASDSGMMGGNISHEFMFVTPVGEDSLALCPQCGYRANMEAAECVAPAPASDGEKSRALGKVPTPGMQTIEEVCNFLNLPKEKSCKAVIYQKDDERYVVLFIRGDLEINETKLINFLKATVRTAVITEDSGLLAGYIGPVNLKAGCEVLYDRSLQGAAGLCCGANEVNYHFTGLNMERDCPGAVFNDFAKIREGDACPQCGEHAITLERGIEIGNIFQLGTKYTKAMGMHYLDSEGNQQLPVMGCYGIGVGRLAASVCEESHDNFGPIWPISIAPWQVHLCCLRADDGEAKAFADSLYKDLQARGMEVIYDDRLLSAGVMFSDADLLGVPVRVVVSPRNMKDGCCEISTRDKSVSMKAPVAEAADEVEALVKKLSGELTI
ncbi:MAG: proline--tRNA ligase [Clostridiales bacterium]|jgi:prolyl-tRNA synthetase|nr:proline--tRNA ligase [Clostridiales bacterium]